MKVMGKDFPLFFHGSEISCPPKRTPPWQGGRHCHLQIGFAVTLLVRNAGRCRPSAPAATPPLPEGPQTKAFQILNINLSAETMPTPCPPPAFFFNSLSGLWVTKEDRCNRALCGHLLPCGQCRVYSGDRKCTPWPGGLSSCHIAEY